MHHWQQGRLLQMIPTSTPKFEAYNSAKLTGKEQNIQMLALLLKCV